ncbi:MAG: NAD-dependent epimerase/dehydratase family protein [Myxococcota bacterium]|jgi:nucleoside-diphosphate-sugar epimerase|nr:NAD-dependent epimerase/dehydratase family protein [Myxococcota bacterium]
MSHTVLITGGAGFIGSNLARAALARGDEVRIIDDLSTGRRANLEGLDIELFEASILDASTLARAVDGCHVVFHMAGQVSVARSVDEPAMTHEVNATGSLRVYQAARAAGVERVVYSASCAAYGQTEALPIHESTAPSPDSPYAASKLMGELYGSAWSRAMGLEVVSLRYFNVYGPRQNPAGGYAAAIPAFITRLLRGEDITIHGDGEQTRDFVFVDDVVQANIRASTAPGAAGHVVNVGSGQRISVNTLVSTLQDIIPSTTNVVHGPPRVGDIRHSVADTSAASALLDFDAATSIAEGLTRTVAWYREASP